MQKVSKIYTTIALLFFNTVLIFVVLNLCALVYGIFDQDAMAAPQEPISDGIPLTVYEFGPLSSGFDLNAQVHYHMEDADLLRMMLETWNLFQVCDEGILFREEPFNGQFVRVDEAGFRRGDAQGPWPPADEAFNIFVFGGSTTFGYGVQDNLTIPADLQYYLRESLGSDQINVYNFGRGAYFSLLEAELFRTLLRDGFVPDMAIFVDGLNEFHFFDGEAPNIGNCEDYHPTRDRWNSTLTCDPGEVCLPLQTLVTNLVGQPESADVHPSRTAQDIETNPTPADDEETNRAVIQNWLDHKGEIEAMAAEHDIPLLFVMQPVPGYAYDLQYHLFVDESMIDSNRGVIARTHYGYPIWDEMYQDGADWTDDVVNLTRLSEDNKGPIYVDGVHYTFGFNDEIAQAIRDAVIERDLIDLSGE